MNFVVIQKADIRQADLLRLTSSYWREYAAHHGYDYHLDTGDFDLTRNGMWMKWTAIMRALDYYPDGTWLFWADVDTLPMNMGITLESFTENIEPSVEFIAGIWDMATSIKISDLDGEVKVDILDNVTKGAWTTVHTGNFLMKVSPWARSFVPRVYNDSRILQNPVLAAHPQGDEVGFAIHIFGNQANRNKVEFIDIDRVFTRPNNNGFGDMHDSIKVYEDGDFIVHAAGMPLSSKIMVLQSYTERIIS